MTALEKLRDWLATYEGFEILSKFHVDYIDQTPCTGSVFPTGMVEVGRHTDILGNVTVENQYNFGLYYVFEKASGDDENTTENANWIMDFQEWIQKQSATGVAPVFGDVPQEEKIIAQNGALYDAKTEGLGTYLVQLSIKFKKYF